MRTKTFNFLKSIFHFIPTDVLYSISKYVGKYLYDRLVCDKIIKIKKRKEKYVMKYKIRSWSI